MNTCKQNNYLSNVEVQLSTRVIYREREVFKQSWSNICYNKFPITGDTADLGSSYNKFSNPTLFLAIISNLNFINQVNLPIQINQSRARTRNQRDKDNNIPKLILIELKY